MAIAAKIKTVLKAKPGKEAELLGTLAEHSRAEAGNRRWDLWQVLYDAARFVIDDLYKDVVRRLLSRHAAIPGVRSRINELATRIAVALRPIDVASDLPAGRGNRVSKMAVKSWQ
jgi:quinol monooxygenase YgiN